MMDFVAINLFKLVEYIIQNASAMCVFINM